MLSPLSSENPSENYLGVFIGDLVSSPAAGGDLLDHRFPAIRTGCEHRMQKQTPSTAGRPETHLLSFLWSSSASRQAALPTSRMITVSPRV